MEKPGADMTKVASAVKEQVSPQDKENQQKLYNILVFTGLNLLYNEKTRDRMMNHFQQGQPPAKAAADIVFMIVQRIEVQAEEDGLGQIPYDLIALAGGEILEHIMRMAGAVHGIEFDADMREDAYYAAVDMYLADKERNGEVNLEGMEELTGIPIPKEMMRGVQPDFEGAERALSEQEPQPAAQPNGVPL